MCTKQFVAVGGLLALSLFSSARADEKTAPWTGPSFREFSAVNHGEPDSPLNEKAIGWERRDLSWGNIEKQQGVWQQDVLEKWGQQVLAFKAKGVQFLPILDYNTPWSTDTTERQWEHTNTRWHTTPIGEKGFRIERFNRQADGTWKLVDTSEKATTDKMWPLAADHVKDWENYVRRMVTFLRKAPYNVEYFQIWNEAYPNSGFWRGDMDSYMQRVHLPAARIIHELGGKVVYGGWPCAGSLGEYTALLDKHKAWKSIDVLDVHYFPVSSFDYLRRATRKRGLPDLPLWQTELAFTTDAGFISNTYPRFLNWALRNKWNKPDQYKLFFFAHKSPNDPKAYGYGRMFFHGDQWAAHGINMKTLGELLDGENLRLLSGVTSSPRLKAEDDERLSSIEALQVQNRAVIAVHLSENNSAKILTDWLGEDDSLHLDHDNPTLNLGLPYSIEKIAKVERVDLAGKRLDITPWLRSAKKNASTIDVPIQDEKGSEAAAWNAASKQAVTFYVSVTLR